MSFATGQDVMHLVEYLIRELCSNISAKFALKHIDDEMVPVRRQERSVSRTFCHGFQLIINS